MQDLYKQPCDYVKLQEGVASHSFDPLSYAGFQLLGSLASAWR